MTIGDRIRTIRKARGLTQREVGEKCGIAEPTIRRYELGKLNPKYETMQRISSALNVPTSIFYEENFSMNNLEKLLSELLTKDPKHPVTLHIDIEEAAAAELEAERESGEGWLEASEAEDTVTIPLSVYEELLASSVKYEILDRAYHSTTYGVTRDVERAVFGVSRAEGTAKPDA